jgi:hypothetical protein
MLDRMTPQEALVYIEMADIRIGGKDTYKERVGEFRELVRNVLNKEVESHPEEMIVIGRNGEDRKALLCSCCGADLDTFLGNSFAKKSMRYCPVCGRRIR